ncbi:MAG: hypothetical protein V2A73_16060 [Pseudomonadota bacterium]
MGKRLAGLDIPPGSSVEIALKDPNRGPDILDGGSTETGHRDEFLQPLRVYAQRLRQVVGIPCRIHGRPGQPQQRSSSANHRNGGHFEPRFHGFDRLFELSEWFFVDLEPPLGEQLTHGRHDYDPTIMSVTPLPIGLLPHGILVVQ